MSLVDKLKEYFKNTPKHKIKSDWDKSKRFDKIGITVEDYLKHQKQANGAEQSTSNCNIPVVSGSASTCCGVPHDNHTCIICGKNVF